MIRFVDSHAHYWDDRFSEEYGKEGVDQKINTLFAESGLSAVINVGTSPETSQRALLQAKRHSAMFAAVGIHPTDSQYIADLPLALGKIEEMLKDPLVVALGEIGLDYHYDDTMPALQNWIFHEQLRIAERCGLPVIVHDRDAHGDVFSAICAHPHVVGVMHSYSGSPEMAKEVIKRGWYISFSGTVTFKNASRVAAVAAALPHDRVLLETDCPYLAPHPYRGQLNHSGMIPLMAKTIAELWGVTPEDVGKITAENTCRLFRLPSYILQG